MVNPAIEQIGIMLYHVSCCIRIFFIEHVLGFS